MCYYNGQRVTYSEYVKLKNFEKALANCNFLDQSLKNGFEYGPNAVLKQSQDGNDIDLVQMEWGFIPHYLKTREGVKNMRFGYKDSTGRFHPPMTTLNAVSEALLLPGKIYRDAALHRRCLVLSTGFYEWRHIFPLNKRTGQPIKTANKYPYYISVKDQEYFFMAGIWQPWTDQETGEYIESFAIVTTVANPLMEQIHNTKKRMPAILTEDLAYEWLFGNPDEKRITQLGRYQFPASQMQAHPIAKDFREAIEPEKEFAYEDLPALQHLSSAC